MASLERRSTEGGVGVSTGREYKCCVCSKAFSTGQALGGHMRWHLERNQLLGLAVAAAASSSSSSQLRWRFGRGEGSGSLPQVGVGSLYSSGRMASFLAMKQHDLQQARGQGAGNFNPINTNTNITPQAFGSWNLGKDGAAATGSSSNAPQSHGGGLFPSTTSTLPRWIHQEGQQRAGMTGVTSQTNPQNLGQMLRWLVAGLNGEQHQGSGGFSARNLPAWLQPSGSGEQQQQQAGTGGRDETINFPFTLGVPFQGPDIMHGQLSLSSDSPIPNPNTNVSNEENRGVWMTPSSATRVTTERSRQLERAPPLDVLAASSRAVQALLASQRRGVGTLPIPLDEEDDGSSSPCSSSSPPSSSTSSSSEIDLELRLGR